MTRTVSTGDFTGAGRARNGAFVPYLGLSMTLAPKVVRSMTGAELGG